MVSHNPAKFGGHRHYDSGDIMFLVKFQDALSLFPHYCLIVKDMGWKHTACQITNSDPGHTHSKQQLGNTGK